MSKSNVQEVNNELPAQAIHKPVEIRKMYAVWDQGAKFFGQVVWHRTTHEAIRTFTDAVNTPDTPFSRHPDQYVMYELGQMDFLTGSFEILPEPQSICRAIDVFLDPKVGAE